MPLSTEQVIRAFQHRGLDVKQAKNGSCTPFYLAATVSNIVEGPEVDENEIVAREGWVTCAFLSQRGLKEFFTENPSPVRPFERRTRFSEEDNVRIYLANVDCAIYFKENQRAQVEKFELAMADLERVVQQAS